jgi:hypothetical protein
MSDRLVAATEDAKRQCQAPLRGAHTKRKFKYGKELSPRGVEFGLLVASRLDLSYETSNVVCDGPDCRASRSASEAIEGLVGSNHGGGNGCLCSGRVLSGRVDLGWRRLRFQYDPKRPSGDPV